MEMSFSYNQEPMLKISTIIEKSITVASLFLTTQDTSYISQTIIDGDSLDSVVKFESGEDTTSVICGFKITNGQGAPYPNYTGGGITCNNSSPRLEKCNNIR